MGRESERRREVESREWKAGKEGSCMLGSGFIIAQMF
jgi:hypothetical protein